MEPKPMHSQNCRNAEATETRAVYQTAMQYPSPYCTSNVNDCDRSFRHVGLGDHGSILRRWGSLQGHVNKAKAIEARPKAWPRHDSVKAEPRPRPEILALGPRTRPRLTSRNIYVHFTSQETSSFQILLLAELTELFIQTDQNAVCLSVCLCVCLSACYPGWHKL